MTLTQLWSALRRKYAQQRKLRAERQALADALHFSNAWECGCWMHCSMRSPIPTDFNVVKVDFVLRSVPVETLRRKERS